MSSIPSVLYGREEIRKNLSAWGSATLRLYVSDAGSVGGEFARVADTSWSESAMTWNTRPAADATPFATLGPVTSATWYDVDVSALVTGDGTFQAAASYPSGQRPLRSRTRAPERDIPLQSTLRGTRG